MSEPPILFEKEKEVKLDPKVETQLNKLARVSKRDNIRMSNKPTKRNGTYPPKYSIGHMVSMPLKYFGFTNGRIVGIEWGNDCKDVMKPIWCYWVVEALTDSSIAKRIPENELGSIS